MDDGGYADGWIVRTRSWFMAKSKFDFSKLILKSLDFSLVYTFGMLFKLLIIDTS